MLASVKTRSNVKKLVNNNSKFNTLLYSKHFYLQVGKLIIVHKFTNTKLSCFRISIGSTYNLSKGN